MAYLSEQGRPQGPKRMHLFALGAAWVILTCLAVVTRKQDWYIAAATFGTALGTLVLALYTFVLARATQESVSNSRVQEIFARDQLAEVQAQRALVTSQLATLIEQAAATKELAIASTQSAREAAKARIDAIAPLLRLDVSYWGGWLRTGGNERADLSAAGPWFLPELDGQVFDLVLDVRVQNVGFSPALTSMNTPSYDGHSIAWVLPEGAVTLEPGQILNARLELTDLGRAAVKWKPLSIGITYHGLLLGEMHDLVRWDGSIRVLEVVNEKASPVEPSIVLHGGFAQVAREYLVLDRPDEIAEGRARLLRGGQGGAA